MKNITLSIFVPCLNEERNINDALSNIKEGVQDINYEILVTDDASKDKTIEVIEKFKNDNPNLNIRIFRNESCKGYGFNYFASAHKAVGKYYLNLSGDACESPETIKKIINNIGKADIIMCYPDFSCRSVFFDAKDKKSFIRRVISRLFVNVINLITFNNMKYYNSSTVHLLENVKLYRKISVGFGFQAELITFLLTLNKTYIQIPTETIERKSGTSKAVTLNNILSVCKSIIRIFLNQITYIIKKILKIN